MDYDRTAATRTGTGVEWPPAPEFYVDAFTIAWSPFGVDLTFGRQFDAESGLKQVKAVINMSPRLAEVLVAELRRIVEINHQNGPSEGNVAPGGQS